MTYRREEYEIGGVNVTIQQVNEGVGASAWINGGAAYMDDAMEVMDFEPVGDTPFDRVKSALAFLVIDKKRYCPKCESFSEIGTFKSTGFAGRQCADCATKAATCEDGGKHDYKCLNPHQRSSARVPTKYKCKKCDKTKQSVPTG